MVLCTIHSAIKVQEYSSKSLDMSKIWGSAGKSSKVKKYKSE